MDNSIMDNPKAHEQTRQTEAEGLYGGLEGWLPRVDRKSVV